MTQNYPELESRQTYEAGPPYYILLYEPYDDEYPLRDPPSAFSWLYLLIGDMYKLYGWLRLITDNIIIQYIR